MRLGYNQAVRRRPFRIQQVHAEQSCGAETPTYTLYFLCAGLSPLELQTTHRFSQSQRRPYTRPLIGVLNLKALVGAFNQEMALVGAFSVIVNTDGSFAVLGAWVQGPGGGDHIPVLALDSLSHYPLINSYQLHPSHTSGHGPL